MATKTSLAKATKAAKPAQQYESVHGGIVDLLQSARVAAARSVNAFMTASYWVIGRRIVEAEQGGSVRAGYGQQLLMRNFYLQRPSVEIYQTVSNKLQIGTSILQTPPGEFSVIPSLADIAKRFPLPWSAYVTMLSVKKRTSPRFLRG